MTKKRILASLVLTALAFAVPLSASAAAKKAKAPTAPAVVKAKVKIGFINSITGKDAPIGASLTNGALLAVEDLRKKGIEVDLIKEDDGCDPKKAALAFEKLTTRDHVTGVVGPYTSSSASAVFSNADSSKTPLLLPAAAKETLTQKGYQYVFRLNAPADVYSSSLMEYLRSIDPSLKTIAFIAENTDFGISTVSTARTYAARHGFAEIASEKYPKGGADFRPLLAKIKSLKPDVIFLVSYEADALLLMRQAREIKLTPKAFVGAGAGYTTQEFVDEPQISSGVLAATQWTDDVNWTGAKAFAKAYVAKYHKEPTYHAACAYEAVRIMAETAAAAGGDPVKTQAGLKAGSWDGIMGKVKFEKYENFTNQNKHQMLVEQAQKGRYVTLFPKSFADGTPIYPFSWK